MAALLSHHPAIQDDDPVRPANGRETVRNDEGRKAASEIEEAVEEGDLGAHVELGGGLVENKNAGARLDRV